MQNETFTTMSPFRFWCNKVLPAVYDDSLSYYELLCKVVDYLDKVIEVNNEQNKAIIELKEKLQEFLDGSFDPYIEQKVNEWFDENEPDIMASIEELNTKVDSVVDDMGKLETKVYDDMDELETRVQVLEETNYSYEGWGGWEVLLNNNSFVAGRSFAKTINNRYKFDSSPLNYYYSEFLNIMAPMPFTRLNIAGTTDRDLQTICATNPHNNVGIDFRVITPWDAEVPRETRVRLILTGLINTPPLNPSQEYNAVIGQQIANIALTYYQAMLDGREFSYGRNFFYRSEPDDIINDSNGRGRMECDTYVGMALRGIPYDLSPYTVLTPNYAYDYEDLYTDVSSAEDWAESTSYSVDDIVKNGDYHYYKCIQAHTSSSAFNPSYWTPVWITNPYEIQWATSMNSAMHPANPYLQRDVLYAGDYAFLGWEQSRVFRNVEQAFTGDVAIWVRRANTPTYWGGTSQSTAFDNVAHVGIIYIENGQKYILHVTGSQYFDKTVVNKTPLEDFGAEPPSYFYRPLYS